MTIEPSEEVKKQLKELKPEGEFSDGIEIYPDRKVFQPIDASSHTQTYHDTKDAILKSYDTAINPEAKPEAKVEAINKLKAVVFECLCLVRGRMKRCTKDTGCIYSPICKEMLKLQEDGKFKIPTEISFVEEQFPGLLFQGNRVVGTIGGGVFKDKSKEYELPPRKQVMIFGGRSLDSYMDNATFETVINSTVKLNTDNIKLLEKK